MNSYMSEVMPAVAAMIVMGLVAILLFIVFETIRGHVQTALRTKKARVAEPPAIAADASHWGEETEVAEEPAASEIAFDGDVGMFEGDFADALQISSLPLKAEVQDSTRDDDAFFEEAKEQNLQPAALASPEPSKIAQDLSRNRDGKQNRREREANNERRDRKAEKQRQRAGKERVSAPDDARKARQQNKRQNRQ